MDRYGFIGALKAVVSSYSSKILSEVSLSFVSVECIQVEDTVQFNLNDRKLHYYTLKTDHSS